MFWRASSVCLMLIGILCVLVGVFDPYKQSSEDVRMIFLFGGMIIVAINVGVMAVAEHLNSLLETRKEESDQVTQDQNHG